MINEKEQKKVVTNFFVYWKNKGYEKGESQSFWLSLIRDVYKMEPPEQFISFEEQVRFDHTSFIDEYEFDEKNIEKTA